MTRITRLPPMLSSTSLITSACLAMRGGPMNGMIVGGGTNP
jgi:hypothetical protein